MDSEPPGRRPAELPGPTRRGPLTILAVATLLASCAVAVAMVAGSAPGKDNGSPAFALESPRRFLPPAAAKSAETDALVAIAEDRPIAPGLSPVAAADLEDELARMVESTGLSGSVAIAVTDMGSGATISYRAEAMQRSGCVVNFFVLALALRDVADGNLLFEDVEPLVANIVGFSDAAAAFDLYLLVGGGDLFYGLERVSLLMEEVTGYGQSILDHPPGFEWDSRGIDENNYITASAMNVALASLGRGDLLPAPWSDYLLDVMANVAPELDYLLADLPDDVIVSHKNGWFAYDDGNVENDTAIVRYVKGGVPGAYVITFMSDTPDAYTSILLAQSVTRLVYTAFTGAAIADEMVEQPAEESNFLEPAADNVVAEPDVPATEAPAEATVDVPVEPPTEPAAEEPSPDPPVTEEPPVAEVTPEPAAESA